MNKVQFWTDQEDLFRQAGQMMSLIETGRHIKSAASDALTREMLDAHRPDKDHFLLHVIALGDHEHFGPNRNGDSWPKAACEQYHPTFVSHGHYFREHRNRDKSQAIGQIKAARFNAPMGRIELAVWGHVKKAEDVLEKLKAGKPIGNSMSARVPYDRSSITGRKAKSPAEYDEYCRYRMNQYIPEHRKFAFVYNDHPTFFDISDVKNPADRIAFALESAMPKAASTGAQGGALLAEAEGVDLPVGERDPRLQAQIEKLAALELYLDAAAAGTAGTDAQALFCKHAAAHAFRGELTEAQLDVFKKMVPGALFRKLAARQVVLPFLSFAAYASGRTLAAAAAHPGIAAAGATLPRLFTKLAAEAAAPELESLCCPGGDHLHGADFSSGDAVDQAMAEATRHFSTEPASVKSRVLENCTAPAAPGEKSAGAIDAEGAQLARAYGHYQLSALEAIQVCHGIESSDARNILVLSHNRSHL
ncbi:MAG TPA: hypothetical protein VLL76_05835 [Candidatus Omnitrophota bacterium]|nr:hypothetical protein [Candidatus Omnitrophota bacterium]